MEQHQKVTLLVADVITDAMEGAVATAQVTVDLISIFQQQAGKHITIRFQDV